MPDPVARPDADNAIETNRQHSAEDWVTPEITKIELETAQQTGGGIPG